MPAAIVYMIKVTYLDHSGFVLSAPDTILVFDYYRDPSHALQRILHGNPSLPVVFFVSHHHRDHFNPGIFEIAQNHERTYALSDDVAQRYVPSTLRTAGLSAGDVVENIYGIRRIKAYGSTDAGVSFLVELADGKSVFHGGDLNLWHWKEESTDEEVRQAADAYYKELRRISSEVRYVDIAMLAVDPRLGSDYAVGAKEFLKEVKVKYFFPMHFDGQYKEVCGFVGGMDASVTSGHCLRSPGESVDVD